MGRKGRETCRFPAARIKKIMRCDDEVGKINSATPVLVSAALELFLKKLTALCVGEAVSRGGKKILASHLKAAVFSNSQLDFLKDFVANVPDPIDSVSVLKDDEDDAPPRKKRKRVSAAKNNPVKPDLVEENADGGNDGRVNVKKNEQQQQQIDRPQLLQQAHKPEEQLHQLQQKHDPHSTDSEDYTDPQRQQTARRRTSINELLLNENDDE